MEELLNNFMYGATGNRPDDYYFIYNSKGAKYFFSKITGKRVAKNNIPAKFHELIREKDSGLDIGQLITLKNNYLLEIERLKAKVEEIDIKLSGVDIQKDELRRQEYEKEQEELLRKLFEQYSNTQSKSDSKDILSKLNIHSKKEWKEWLLLNHPDKILNCDIDLCKEIITAGRTKGW